MSSPDCHILYFSYLRLTDCWTMFRLCYLQVLHLSSFVLSTNPSFIIQAAAQGPDPTSLLQFPPCLMPASPSLGLL